MQLVRTIQTVLNLSGGGGGNTDFCARITVEAEFRVTINTIKNNAAPILNWLYARFADIHWLPCRGMILARGA